MLFQTLRTALLRLQALAHLVLYSLINLPLLQAILQFFGLKDNMAVGGKGFTSQTFTSSGTWTCPAGVTQVILIGCGGGQAGGNCATSASVLAVGGKGTVPGMKTITVVPNTTYTITIGVGGSTAGAAGTSTTFGVLATFNGASTELNFDSNVGTSFPSPASAPTHGTMGWRAAPGTNGANASTWLGGTGGACGTTGAGGAGGAASSSGAGSAGTAAGATNYGAGGGAGGAGPSSGGAGGAGAGGFLNVIWVET